MINAIYNHGRWVALCPQCLEQGSQVAELVKFGGVFICPVDYPDLYATTLVPNPRVKGAFNSVPDQPLREETRQRAIDEGAAQTVIFPENWKEIENDLRTKPVHERNWHPVVAHERMVNDA